MIETFSFKGYIIYIVPTFGFWKNNFKDISSNEGVQYGLQFNWFKWQIGILWKKK